jgi:uroporphyrinogen decarboxylase
MNSRERVRAVINHQLSDYVPNGLGGCETAGLHVMSYDTLQKILGVKRHPPRIDTFMTNAVFETDVIAAMEGDIILIYSPRMCRAALRGKGAEGKWREQELWGRTFRVPLNEVFKLQDDGSIIWEKPGSNVKCPAGSWYFDTVSDSDLMAEFNYPDPDDFNPQDSFTDEFLRDLEETAKELYESTELSLCLGETITDLQYLPGGMIGGMVLMMENPDLIKAYMQKSVDAGLKQISILEQAAGKYVDILSIAHDFGDNRCVTMGDELWREIYKPFYKQLFQGWHKRTRMKSNLHTCGSVETILGDLIECGLDIYNPVQISARNMSAENLKARFGRELVFWGGDYDAQMMKGRSYDEVYAHVSGNLNVFKQGGGHIFSGVHNLPADLAEDHLRAMFDAWRKNR